MLGVSTLLIVLFVLIQGHFILSYNYNKQQQLIELNKSQMMGWYDEVFMCMYYDNIPLKDAAASLAEHTTYCQKKTNNTDSIGIPRLTHGYHGGCCYNEIKL